MASSDEGMPREEAINHFVDAIALLTAHHNEDGHKIIGQLLADGPHASERVADLLVGMMSLADNLLRGWAKAIDVQPDEILRAFARQALEGQG